MSNETKINLVTLYAGLIAQGLASTETEDAEWEPKVLAERSVDLATALAKEIEKRGLAGNPSQPTSGSKR